MVYQPIDLLLFPALAQGYVLGIILQRLRSKHHHAHRALAALLYLSSTLLVGRVLVRRMPDYFDSAFGMVADTSIFLYGPLLYIFVRQLFQKERYQPPFFHWLPVLLHLALIVVFSTLGRAYFLQLQQGPSIWYWYGGIELFGLLLNTGYWVVTIRILWRRWRLRKWVWAQVPPSLKFLLGILILVGLGLLLWTIAFVSAWVFRYPIYVIGYNTMWFFLASITYLIGAAMLLRPEAFRQTAEALPTAPVPDKDRLDQGSIQQLTQRLDKLMHTEHLYVQGDLSLAQLAQILDTSVQNLSWLLNQHYQQSFYSYVNSLRIQAFLEKVTNGEHHQKTLLAMAMEVGFNAKSTFNRAFKEIHGCTPTQYVNLQGNISSPLQG